MRETMVQRQDDERPVMRRNVDARQRLFDVGRVVAVRQHHALGVGRCARRVGDRRIIVVPDRLACFQELLPVFGQIVAAQAFQRTVSRLSGFQRNVSENDHMLQLRQFGADAADLRQLVFRHENGLDFGVPHAEQQVVRLFELHRQRHADRPGVEQSQFGDDPRVAAFGQDGDLVARANPRRSEARTDFERLLFGFGIGRGLEFAMPFLEQESFGPVLFDGGFEEVDDGLFHDA